MYLIFTNYILQEKITWKKKNKITEKSTQFNIEKQ
jgi:hypothetical protein